MSLGLNNYLNDCMSIEHLAYFEAMISDANGFSSSSFNLSHMSGMSRLAYTKAALPVTSESPR